VKNSHEKAGAPLMISRLMIASTGRISTTDITRKSEW